MKTTWKFYMIIALVCAAIQWLLLGINVYVTGNFNWIVFPQALVWTLWGFYCLGRYVGSKTIN